MLQWMLSHLGLFLCVLPHDRWLRVGTAMAYNGWSKHLGQTSSWHLVGVTVGGNPVWKERRRKVLRQSCIHAPQVSLYSGVCVNLLLQVEYHKSKSVFVAGGQLSYGLQCRGQTFLLTLSLCRDKGHNKSIRYTTPHCHATSNTN